MVAKNFLSRQTNQVVPRFLRMKSGNIFILYEIAGEVIFSPKQTKSSNPMLLFNINLVRQTYCENIIKGFLTAKKI